MRNRQAIFVILLLIPVLLLAACVNPLEIRAKNPVTLTLWHNYGGQLKETMDTLIDEFNETVGVEKGIMISVTSISGSAALHEKLNMAANEDPGAPPLPDITTAYPKTALILAEKGLLADLNEQFTPEELSAYIPEFLQEGCIKADSLYVFPTAKSTETLFVNTTIFNRFAEDTGARLEDLETWEGIIRTAALYYDWTDQLTPAVENDGKMLFMPDSLFNLAQIGYQQLGAEFITSLSMMVPLTLRPHNLTRYGKFITNQLFWAKQPFLTAMPLTWPRRGRSSVQPVQPPGYRFSHQPLHIQTIPLSRQTLPSCLILSLKAVKKWFYNGAGACVC